ncbi:hypothetical protein BDEG_21817 [Batrachochytrium dendrobatidis JEL423]|uniref:Alpha-type protein kinase domain-containing protein n=2 Tax=Batrachochytrium dendrobatidis (strain JEL423) TaxID=403673 RepID=A0A177WEP8_BATDL|nr:hypothetical protein BDEG_21817 [Batrachochytrium dendrobatidis JEL423]
MTTNFARENDSFETVPNMDVVFARGAFKNVYKGKYTKGNRTGQESVTKIFKSGSVFQESYFDNELKIVNKALEIINRFNKDQLVDQNIWLNIPAVWTFLPGTTRAGEKCLVEPMIINFQKFNSNTGWTSNELSGWTLVMQALSHYSYHVTDCQLLLCDLQGGIQNNGFIITDPVVMSRTQEYGPTDFGPKGISTFFSRHNCNKFCKKEWKVPQDKKAYYNVQMGSAMALPGHIPAAPLAANGRVDFGYASMNQLPGLVEGLEIIEE